MSLETLNQIFPQHRAGQGTPVVLTQRQVRAVAEKAGFKPGVAKQMAQIARGESSFQPGVVSNDGGYGLWQMTPRVWGPEAIQHMNKLGGLKAMSNPLQNAKMAKWLYDRGGFEPWFGTKYLNRGMDTSKIHSVLNASDRRKGYIAAVQDGQPQTRRDTTTTIQPGGQDIDAALTDILMQGSGKVESIHNRASLATKLVSALDSGLYDQPDTITKHVTESQVPGAPVTVGGGNKPSALKDGGDAVARAARRANRLDAKKLPYLYGGGHQVKRVKIKNTGPLDCSAAVSAVLGVDVRVSGEFERFGKPGRSKDGITIYANKDHVLMSIAGKFFGTSRSNPGGGAGWIPASAVPESYLKNFTARHI